VDYYCGEREREHYFISFRESEKGNQGLHPPSFHIHKKMRVLLGRKADADADLRVLFRLITVQDILATPSKLQAHKSYNL
jgi:hypothetical protein